MTSSWITKAELIAENEAMTHRLETLESTASERWWGEIDHRRVAEELGDLSITFRRFPRFGRATKK